MREFLLLQLRSPRLLLKSYLKEFHTQSQKAPPEKERILLQHGAHVKHKWLIDEKVYIEGLKKDLKKSIKALVPDFSKQKRKQKNAALSILIKDSAISVEFFAEIFIEISLLENPNQDITTEIVPQLKLWLNRRQECPQDFINNITAKTWQIAYLIVETMIYHGKEDKITSLIQKNPNLLRIVNIRQIIIENKGTYTEIERQNVGPVLLPSNEEKVNEIGLSVLDLNTPHEGCSLLHAALARHTRGWSDEENLLDLFHKLKKIAVTILSPEEIKIILGLDSTRDWVNASFMNALISASDDMSLFSEFEALWAEELTRDKKEWQRDGQGWIQITINNGDEIAETATENNRINILKHLKARGILTPTKAANFFRENFRGTPLSGYTSITTLTAEYLLQVASETEETLVSEQVFSEKLVDVVEEVRRAREKVDIVTSKKTLHFILNLDKTSENEESKSTNRDQLCKESIKKAILLLEQGAKFTLPHQPVETDVEDNDYQYSHEEVDSTADIDFPFDETDYLEADDNDHRANHEEAKRASHSDSDSEEDQHESDLPEGIQDAILIYGNIWFPATYYPEFVASPSGELTPEELTEEKSFNTLKENKEHDAPIKISGRETSEYQRIQNQLKQLINEQKNKKDIDFLEECQQYLTTHIDELLKKPRQYKDQSIESNVKSLLHQFKVHVLNNISMTNPQKRLLSLMEKRVLQTITPGESREYQLVQDLLEKHVNDLEADAPEIRYLQGLFAESVGHFDTAIDFYKQCNHSLKDCIAQMIKRAEKSLRSSGKTYLTDGILTREQAITLAWEIEQTSLTWEMNSDEDRQDLHAVQNFVNTIIKDIRRNTYVSLNLKTQLMLAHLLVSEESFSPLIYFEALQITLSVYQKSDDDQTLKKNAFEDIKSFLMKLQRGEQLPIPQEKSDDAYIINSCIERIQHANATQCEVFFDIARAVADKTADEKLKVKFINLSMNELINNAKLSEFSLQQQMHLIENLLSLVTQTQKLKSLEINTSTLAIHSELLAQKLEYLIAKLDHATQPDFYYPSTASLFRPLRAWNQAMKSIQAPEPELEPGNSESEMKHANCG